MTYLINIFYRIRYYFIKESSPSATKSGLIPTLSHDFKDGISWDMFDKWFSMNAFKDYSAQPKLNCIVGEKDGVLLLDRRNSDPNAEKKFESGYLYTANKFKQTYGLFELICKVPEGGLTHWAAFWLYGKKAPPEIDIFETMSSKEVGKDYTKRFSTTTHIGESYENRKQYGHELVGRQDLSKEFHKYSLLWTPQKLVWMIDDIPVRLQTKNIPQTPMSIMLSLGSGISPEKFGRQTGVFELKQLNVYSI